MADHLGSTNVITNAAGDSQELIEYQPYGAFARHEKYGAGEDVAWFYFTGQHYDDESELYALGNGTRYYDPVLGRFLQADTLVPYPNNPQTFNRYSYCHNNPVNLIDPSGHWAWLSNT